MGWNGSTLDADIWTFTIASGFEVSAINLVTYNGSNPVFPNGHFMALASGNTIDTAQSVNHLSNGLWREELDGLGNTNTNLLAILQAGDYTFWVQGGHQLREPILHRFRRHARAGAGERSFARRGVFPLPAPSAKIGRVVCKAPAMPLRQAPHDSQPPFRLVWHDRG
jgi:hypothetical protein